MGYLNVNVDIDIDYDDISDDDLFDIIEYKLKKYKKSKTKEYYQNFTESILEHLNDDVNIINIIERRNPTVEDWLITGVLDKLKQKFTLQELETFLNK